MNCELKFRDAFGIRSGFYKRLASYLERRINTLSRTFPLTILLLSPCLNLSWINLPSCFHLATFFLPSSYPPFCIYQKNKSITNCSLLVLRVLPNFCARTLFACYRRDARIRLRIIWEFAIPTAEKSYAKPKRRKNSNHWKKHQFLHITSCRTATMRVANSRYNDAAEFGNSAERGRAAYSLLHPLPWTYLGRTNNFWRNCSLRGKGTKFNPEVTDKTRAKIDSGKANPGYFTAKK